MRPSAWTSTHFLLAGGAAIALAASAETAWAVHARFALDLAGLSAFERTAAALWDLRPLAPAVFVAAGVVLLLELRRAPDGPARPAAAVRRGLSALAAAHVALAAVVLGLAVWVAATGELGRRDELGFVYTPGERVVTLVTQLLAWIPVAALSAALAWAAAVPEDEREPPVAPAPEAETALVLAEMETLWRERLAIGPRREQARRLLERIRALEEAGDHDGARGLAEEMRRL